MRAQVREHSFASIGRPSQPASPGLTSGLPRVGEGHNERRPPTEAAFTSMLQFANEARQTVDKILNPTIFTRSSLCDRLHHRPSMGLVMAARSSLDKSSFGSFPG